MKKKLLAFALACIFLTVIVCGCHKQSFCDGYKAMSWTEYNSVKTVYCYFNVDDVRGLVNSHIGDTVLVTGYILDYYRGEYPSVTKWYYIADTIISPEEPMGRHLLVSFHTQNWEQIPLDGTRRVYCKCHANYNYTDGYSMDLWIDKIDTIPQ